MMGYLFFLTGIAGAFLLGGIPFSLLLGRLIKGVDIRKQGSGNVGATNLGRLCGWGWFPVAFALDFTKGAVPPLLAVHELLPHLPSAPPIGSHVLYALVPVLGHIFSPYLGFKGGKGVATGTGGMAMLLPLETGVAFLGWLLVLALTRTVGIASAVAALLLPASFFCLSGHSREEYLFLGTLTSVLALFIIYRHKTNIKAYLGNRAETRSRKKN